MTSPQRLALALAAAALLVGGFFVAKGGSDDATTTAPGTPAATAQSPDPVSTGGAASATTADAPAPPMILVTGGKPAGGVKKLTVAKGAQVRFRVRSDVADEIHVHGYDLKQDVKAGGTVTFAFKASIDGIFEIELEGAGEQIASLTVTP